MIAIADAAPPAALCHGVILRTAGLPIRHWLAAANPPLFRDVACVQAALGCRRLRGIELAERIGTELVPDPTVTSAARALLLRLRRRLHRGDLLDTWPRDRLLDLELDGHVELLGQLARLAEEDRRLADRVADIDQRLADEQTRLMLLPQRIAEESPIARRLLAESRPSAGHVSPKRARHRFERDWRSLTRASTSATPRGWFSHVALLSANGRPDKSPVRVGSSFAQSWTEDVRARRRAMAAPPADWPGPDAQLALNPLHWQTERHLITVVLDHHVEPTQVTVRRSPFLNALCAALGEGPCRFADLSARLADRSGRSGCSPTELGAFVRHLTMLGVVQADATPRTRLGRAERADTHAIVGADGNQPELVGWTDVYRTADGGIPADLHTRLQPDVALALRLLTALDREPRPARPHGSPASWTFADILEADLAAEHAQSAVPLPDRSSPADAPRRRLARDLHDRIAAAGAGAVVVIDPFLVSRYAPCTGPTAMASVDWPVDCIVRAAASAADSAPVLEQVWPAGVVDARFADALSSLHGALPQLDSYAEFLRELEARTGYLLVEILAPPLSDGAANAVRRPLYTRAWTGDPHTGAYLGNPGSARYLPLTAIRIQRLDGHLRADVDGQPIWPVYHATRSFSPPWDRIAAILLASAPYRVAWAPQTLANLLEVGPEQPVLSRISLPGGTIVSPARWRLTSADMADPDRPLRDRVAALARLRDVLGLPRWLWLAGTPPVACDLQSLLCLRVLERTLASVGAATLTEMLPAPDELLVAGQGRAAADRFVSQFVLRFPHKEAPAVMAARVVELLGAAGSSFPARHSSRTRSEPERR